MRHRSKLPIVPPCWQQDAAFVERLTAAVMAGAEHVHHGVFRDDSPVVLKWIRPDYSISLCGSTSAAMADTGDQEERGAEFEEA